MNHAHQHAQRRVRILGVFATLGVVGVVAGAAVDVDARPVTLSVRPVAAPTVTAFASRGGLLDFASLVGRSGKLRALFVSRSKPAFAVAALEQLFGDSAIEKPGVYPVSDNTTTRPFFLITMLPFSAKHAGRIGQYRLGYWPHERRRLAYASSDALPDGFIEVTQANEDTYVSEHFQLRDFLTHDQDDVWPKYLVLDQHLVDKLELVIEDLDEHGIPVRHLTIMSGFRTPEYNIRGVGRHGRARDSRHQYGDAADVFVDNDESGRMSDLNHDGRVDWRDAKVIRDAVDRVEAAHPELVGGMGIYRATRSHGPFLHIDTRGYRARWGVR